MTAIRYRELTPSELISEKKLIEIFNLHTCNESREMTIERFKSAVYDVLTALIKKEP